MTTNAQLLIKFKALQNEAWIRPVFRNEFCLKKMDNGTDRICFTNAMAEPFYFLYVLLVSRRANHEPARYHSPELSREKLRSFLAYNANFFEQDARHNIWIHSPADKSTLVYDRHEIGYAYGPIESFKAILINNGSKEVQAVEQYTSVPHEHHFHAEFDDEEASVIQTFDWQKSPLREQDQPK